MLQADLEEQWGRNAYKVLCRTIWPSTDGTTTDVGYRNLCRPVYYSVAGFKQAMQSHSPGLIQGPPLHCSLWGRSCGLGEVHILACHLDPREMVPEYPGDIYSAQGHTTYSQPVFSLHCLAAPSSLGAREPLQLDSRITSLNHGSG